ncbi:MAG: insulinase family protein, partial [Ignavibacteria bacterium]|nr:insulinase family protein [Ignavibacteria bacterium]
MDFEQTIQLVDKYFGKLKKGNPPVIQHPKEAPITKPIIKEVFGPQPEFLVLGYRLMGYNDPELMKAYILDQILSNGKAGLIDLDLIKSQKVLDASTYLDKNIDYSVHSISASPREGQSLEELKQLILAEIEKIKKGEFDDWLIEAIINNIKLSRMRAEETNGIAHTFAVSFTMKEDWLKYYTFIKELEKITKQDIVKFANEHYKDNYVCVFKRIGKDENIVKVEKPEITPVQMNRDSQSAFYQRVMSMEVAPLKPVFLDFEKDIKRTKLSNGIEFNFIQNKINDLFQLSFILDMGKNHDLKTELAVDYLPYIGTTKYSPQDLSKEFYKLGINLSVSTSDDRSYISISGLKQNLEKGLELHEHTLANAKPDQQIYNDFVDGIIKSRNDAKLDKNSILWGAMFSYAMYDGKSPFTNILSEEELRNINPKELTDIIKNLLSYKHYIFYYGKDAEFAQKAIEKI